MQLALNASILRAPRTGIGHYVAELAGALSDQTAVRAHYFDGVRWADDLPAAVMPGYSRLSLWLKRIVPNAYTLRRALQQRCFERGVPSGFKGVYHEPSLWPFEYDGPMVMTLHDLTHVHFPQTQPADRLLAIERYSGPAVVRAQRILVDSQFMAGEVQQHYGLATSKVIVAPLGISARFYPREASSLQATLQHYGLTHGQYVLCVGTLEPRKNLPMVLRAYAQLPAVIRVKYPLLLVGMGGWRSEQVTPVLERALAGGDVRALGYLPNDVLAQLYAGARALIFPSLYEGFGLPALEAMASGTPVLLSNCSSLPEVAGAAGTYVHPQDVDGCTKALLQLIEDEHYWQSKREAGLIQAAKFSWLRCAQTTLQAYREAMEQA